MKSIIVSCLFVVLVVAIAGCSKTPDVVVTDRAGVPIAGATVTGTSLSNVGHLTTTNISKTDKEGFAIIPVTSEETQPRETHWISITKPGCLPVSHIDANQEKPIKVVMIVLEDSAAR